MRTFLYHNLLYFPQGTELKFISAENAWAGLLTATPIGPVVEDDNEFYVKCHQNDEDEGDSTIILQWIEREARWEYSDSNQTMNI